MNSRMVQVVSCVFAIVGSRAAVGEEIARWNFDGPDAVWQAVSDVELNVADGFLHLKPTGPDPHFAAPIDAPAGWHRITIRARFEKSARFQVFWTTENFPSPSEDRSVDGSFSSNGQFRSCQLWFHTDSPVTSIRIDPPGTSVTVDWILLTDDEPREAEATPADRIAVVDGFRVERLHSVRAEEHGSWVCMTPDSKGRLIVSDQYGGLYRITPPPIGSEDEVVIEPIDVEIGMAQGLLYAFDSLYVNVNGTEEEERGLYRVTDTDGDDRYDHVEFLRRLYGGGEHGPHAVVLSPDGQSLHVCAGNHTDPTDFSASRLPRNWGEDQLLPRMWDAGGHAVGRLAPAGWIAQVSPDGSDWQLIAAGFRNEYDIAFSPEGELFTYDADMEWDVGTPWYRPTRVCHATSGAEFGWRSGTGKWPVWYPDSLPPTLNIGPGSPTGIVFGTGARFPEKYQKALFISDWSYGIVYAVHLQPDGATWKATRERFLSAAPLPVTDLVISPSDGALYFTIGGRRTQSGLYRVTYTGSESTEPAVAAPDAGSSLRKLRRRLEALHHPGAADAVETAWPFLGHPDRFIRYAARIAVEHQPVESWAARAAAEDSSVDAALTALLALVRQGPADWQPQVLNSLERLGSRTITEEQSLAALRVLGLCFIRMGAPDDNTAAQIAATLNTYYPSDSVRLNRELCALLVYLNDETVIEKTLKLMQEADTQEEQIHYALCLRVMKDHWTIPQRKAYFRWFITSTEMAGGHSFSGFLNNIRQEAIDRLSPEEAEQLKDVLAQQPKPAEPVIESISRPLVKRWTVDELAAAAATKLHGRSFENGRRMFQAAGCYRCHRFAGRGGIVGPDLSAAGRRFSTVELLESIVEPSKVISDQYVATVFILDSGKQVTGRVVNLAGDRMMVAENLLTPGRLTTVYRNEVEEMFHSDVSLMPQGLLDHLTLDEILDLLAFIRSGGDPQAPEFRDP